MQPIRKNQKESLLVRLERETWHRKKGVGDLKGSQAWHVLETEKKQNCYITEERKEIE